MLAIAPASIALGKGEAAAATKSPGDAKEKPACWRDRYTLGPEDILNFSLFGHPDLDRGQLFVQPDGTITYLQAQNVQAEGLTIDELRAAIEKQLSEFYKQPRVIISPVELRSKKYFILGKVVDRGAFAMDRPITILEAVARSRGLETGLFQQNTVELADMARSFLIRKGQRMDVDFQKLFYDGDMTQNIELEPQDYLYFSSANTDEIYVLGEVNSPNPQGFTPRLTVLAAITQRDGFTKAAYRERVLVVRGSIKKPQLFVVDTNAILKGRAPDFPLEPKDIVYVSNRPWKVAEDMADAAVSTFIQAAVTTWTGDSIGPLIKHQLIPTGDVH